MATNVQKIVYRLSKLYDKYSGDPGEINVELPTCSDDCTYTHIVTKRRCFDMFCEDLEELLHDFS